MTVLDFMACRPHYFDHLIPIYKALAADKRGGFYVNQDMVADVAGQLLPSQIKIVEAHEHQPKNPILVASYGDLSRAVRNSAPQIIMMEHGITEGFGTSAYPSAKNGRREAVSLFLVPNERVAQAIRTNRQTRCEVIGTPKMDKWTLGQDLMKLYSRPTNTKSPVIAISFHWGNQYVKPPESGSAYEYYREMLPELAKRYQLIGHGHPLGAEVYRAEYEHLGIEWAPDFKDVLRLADIYICDNSSTIYEFLLTGKPVIILNAPWFRRDVHWGVRFWNYADVGIQVNHPIELFPAIETTLSEYGAVCRDARLQAITDLYPYAGFAARRAASVLEEFVREGVR